MSTHHVFKGLIKKYGPIMFFHFIYLPILVINFYEMDK